MNSIFFDSIIGNEDVKKRLLQMVSKRAIGHALLFAGPEGIGKSLFARALAAEILLEYGDLSSHASKIQAGVHPDLHIYRPEGKLGLHSIESLRTLSEEVHLPPYEASWKFFIIYEADRMLSYSANALLKTFEEPPPRTLIILLSHSSSALLPTILSRCSVVHFHPLSPLEIQEGLKQKYQLDASSCEKIASQAEGSLKLAIQMMQQGNSIQDRLSQILSQSPFIDYKDLQEKILVISEEVEKAKKEVQEASKEELYRLPSDELSAFQRQAIEKEIEGFVSLTSTRKAKEIFDFILSWYRDLHLLLMGGSPSFLINQGFKSDIEQMIQRGHFKPFEEVQKAAEVAFASLQRSTPLHLCLENLFLKLDCI